MNKLPEFARRLSEDTELRNRLDLAAKGASREQRAEVLASFAKKNGFDVSASDAQQLCAAIAERELSKDDLDRVSGGGVIMGEMPANGLILQGGFNYNQIAAITYPCDMGSYFTNYFDFAF